MANKGWKNVHEKVYFPTAEELAALRDECENGDTPFSVLAVKYRTTKSTIIGLLYRRNWKLRKGSATDSPTLNDRLDALHAKLDTVFIECQNAGNRTDHTR